MEQFELDCRVMIPEFFVVGAPKAGTTSLFKYLSRCHEIFVPRIKEPHFFSCPEVKDTYYDVHFVESESEYHALYSGVPDGYLAGDFSPSYLFSSLAARRIRSVREDAKIVILLRNPVDRAVSHYLMDTRRGVHDLPFSMCLTNTETTRLFYREYVETGRYADQVARYLQLFPADQVLVLLYEELQKSTEQTVCRILKFLGRPQRFKDPGIRHNAHRDFRFRSLKRLSQSAPARRMAGILPSDARQWLVSALTTTKKPEFVKEKKLLKELFEVENRRLGRVIKRDVSHWNEPGS